VVGPTSAGSHLAAYSRRMTDRLEAYLATRDRICTVVRDLPADSLDAIVPACPEWSVKDLLGHVVGLPAAIGSGNLPDGDLEGWLRGIVDERRSQPLGELLGEWEGLDTAIAATLSGSDALYGDLVVHEHDLLAAVRQPDSSSFDAEIVLPMTMSAASFWLRDTGLGAIEVRDADRVWISNDGPIGWTIEVSAWEAVRALNSRRTADELRSLPGTGAAEPFIAVLDAHLPLPGTSLGEVDTAPL
jgi:hypothetical protein